MKPGLALPCTVMLPFLEVPRTVGAQKPEDVIRHAVTFYASFDNSRKADIGRGDLSLATRSNHPTEKGKFIFEKGFNDQVFRLAPGKGVSGGCLEVVDVLPDNGRIFFPAK